MTTNNVKVAIRAFRRIWFPVEVMLGQVEEADVGFDGGEFSGEFHCKQRERLQNEYVAKVAARFGIPAEHLEYSVREAEHFEQDCFCHKLQKLPLPEAPTYTYEPRTLRITGRCEDGRMWYEGSGSWGFRKDEATLYGATKAGMLVTSLRETCKGWMYQIEAKGEKEPSRNWQPGKLEERPIDYGQCEYPATEEGE